MTIPKLDNYYPSETDMDASQLAFYRELEKHLDQGEYYDIEHNIGYVFVYLYKLLERWNQKGFEYLSDYLTYISELYHADEKLSDYCLYWAHDCLLGQRKYEEYLEVTEPEQAYGAQKDQSNLRLNLQRILKFRANPIDLLLLVGGRKTKFIVENEGCYKEKLFEVFEETASSKGDWFDILDAWHPNVYSYTKTLFNGTAIFDKPELEFKVEVYCSRDKHINYIKSLARDAENRARDDLGVPRIGEGWISETTLFRKLESEFSYTAVIHHGHPKWLGRQHFDVWFPNWKIAVEYHGKQHFEPVEHFGGEESFKQTVQRDLRKASLAEAHGVKLFVVTEDDDQDDLIQRIRETASIRKVVSPLNKSEV